MAQTFKVGGETYEIAYTIKRIEMYEAGHAPLMTSITRQNGWFSVAELRDLIAYGLRAEGGEYVSPEKAREMAEGIIEANSYRGAYNAVLEVLRRDCGFFFKAPKTEG